DGILDTLAHKVAGGPGTLSIWAALSGSELYLATDDSGEGSDHFLFLSDAAPGAARRMPWAKAGMQALGGRIYFMADENDSRFGGWFQWGPTADILLVGAGETLRPDLRLGKGAWPGGVLEGTIDL